jgi:hypothetical protein
MFKTEVSNLVKTITSQISEYNNTGKTSEICVIEVSAEEADTNAKVCIALRNERYFIAYVSNPLKPISVVWSDMEFICKNFGIMRYDSENVLPSTDQVRVNSPVTIESLNYGRMQNLSDYQKAIDLNVTYTEISSLQEDGSFGTYESKDEYGRKITVQRVPSRLTKSMKKGYEREIADGLFVICKYIGKVELGFSI